MVLSQASACVSSLKPAPPLPCVPCVSLSPIATCLMLARIEKREKQCSKYRTKTLVVLMNSWCHAHVEGSAFAEGWGSFKEKKQELLVGA